MPSRPPVRRWVATDELRRHDGDEKEARRAGVPAGRIGVVSTPPPVQ